jgi:hypothetical protein
MASMASMHRRWLGVVLLRVSFGCGGQTAGQPAIESTTNSDGGYGGSFATFDAPNMGGDETAAPSDAAEQPSTDALGGDDGAAQSDTSSGPPSDAGPSGACTQPLAPGDLVIDELMIESVAGSGDYGEWLEVQSTLDCALDLKGLHGDCPRGAMVATFDVTSDIWIPPRGTFLVADSSRPAINHHLPGTLLVWYGQPGDVLRNKGTTVSLRVGDTIVDSLTYPALSLTVGTSLAFPADCDPSVRTDFSRWQHSTASWFPGFLGTPNEPNVDVHCP